MNRPRRLWACLRLARPGNLLIAGISIAVGAAVSRPVALEPALWVILGGMLVAGGGNAANDYFDREADRHVKPHRPIPCGHIRPAGAALLAGVLFAAGWALSLRGGWGPAGLVLIWVVLLIAYSAGFKRAGFAGNVLVSAVVASAFLLGGLLGERPFHSLIPAGLAFLFHLGREIIKDVQDLEGDAVAGVATLAVRRGDRAALRTAAVVLSILIAATFVPYLAGAYNRTYLGAVVVGVDLPLAYVIWTILGTPSRGRLGTVSGLLKADMIVGIGCVLVGASVV